MKRTSLTEKMILYFLTLGIGSIIITGVFSFFTARSALLERTYDQLTSIRLSRQAQVESFFADRLRETTFYADSEEAKKLAGAVLSGNFNNATLLTGTNSRTFLTSGYFSGFLILDNSGHEIYRITQDTAINKETLLISNQSFKANKQEAYMTDYQITDKSSANQLLSISAIRSNGNIVAYLALIVRSEKIDDFMLEVDPANGLGYSGETYLVGPDYLMRSRSRFITNSVMRTTVKTIPVLKALKNVEGITRMNDYRGHEVLSSFGHIKTDGLKWVILAEIDFKEVIESINAIRNNILLLTVFIGLAFFIITYVISRKITRPLIKLKNAAVEFGEGRLNSLVGIESHDEIGELTEAFNLMVISLREKDEALKSERYNRLRSAIDGQDQERQRLSREMHDGIGQSMIAIRLRLGALENASPEKTRINLKSVISLTDNLIDEVRAISNALMPPSLIEFGLTAAIRNLCNSLTESSGIQTSLEGELPGKLLGRKARLYIFRILQEALNNVAKHSEATTLKIESNLDENILYISIADNGKGFDQQSPCKSNGHGLNNIRERASLLNGKASITSVPGAGTSIQIEIPVFNNNL